MEKLEVYQRLAGYRKDVIECYIILQKDNLSDEIIKHCKDVIDDRTPKIEALSGEVTEFVAYCGHCEKDQIHDLVTDEEDEQVEMSECNICGLREFADY